MRKYLSALSLLLIAPLVAEVLPGSAPITQPRLLPFIVLIYGPGALLIRDVARAHGLRWTSILFFGAAYGIVEEGVALQSLFNPALYDAASWGRIGSINVVYAEAVIPIHAIWSAAVPILLTDLLYPEQRLEPYFGRLGRFLTGIWYLFGLALLTLLTRSSIAPGFWAKPALIVAIAALALALIVAAFFVQRAAPAGLENAIVPGLFRTFLATTTVALLWHFLLARLWRFAPRFASWPLMLLPMVAAALILFAGYRSLSRRVTSHHWSDHHWFALASGLVIAHTLFGLSIFCRSNFEWISTLALEAAFLTTFYVAGARRPQHS